MPPPYKLQQRGVPLPPHLQAVLDEMHYDPEAPLSTGSIFALSPQQIARLQPKAENGDTAAAIRLSQYYRMASGFTPEDQRLADYWEAKAASTSQAQ